MTAAYTDYHVWFAQRPNKDADLTRDPLTADVFWNIARNSHKTSHDGKSLINCKLRYAAANDQRGGLMERWQVMQVIDCRLREIGQAPDTWSVMLTNRHRCRYEIHMATEVAAGAVELDIDEPPSKLRAIVDEMVNRCTPALNAGCSPSSSERASIADIKALLQRDVEGLARRLAPDGYRSGRYWMARNPTRDDHKPGSFWIILTGTAPGVWKEEASGETGDVIAFVKYCLRFEKLADALDWCRDWLGLAKGPVNPKVLEMARADTARRKEQDASSPPSSSASIAAGRMRCGCRASAISGRRPSRRISNIAASILPPSPAARCDPGAGLAPASRKRDGLARHGRRHERAGHSLRGRASHVARPRRRGKAPVTPNKKIWPSFTGAAIHLARGETGLPAEDAVKRGMVDRLLICEGIEDGLSVALAAPELRVWAAGTLGNLAHVKIPDCCHEVIVAADNDWGSRRPRRC